MKSKKVLRWISSLIPSVIFKLQVSGSFEVENIIMMSRNVVKLSLINCYFSMKNLSSTIPIKFSTEELLIKNNQYYRKDSKEEKLKIVREFLENIKKCPI